MGSAAASITGKEHLRVGRNNQDGWALLRRGEVELAVVCDGCSSQPFSEVGARLGAHVVAEEAARLIERGVELGSVPSALGLVLDGWLKGHAEALGHEAFARFFLFTVMGVARLGRSVVVFGAGDGAWCVDEQVRVLDSGPENAPEYAAYRLLDATRGQLETHYVGEGRIAAVATDGLEDALRLEPTMLRAFFDDESVFTNPAALQRRLNVLGEKVGFADDCTIAGIGGLP